jgi:hypothetical protein
MRGIDHLSFAGSPTAQAASGELASATNSVEKKIYTAHEGDTAWGIASRAFPEDNNDRHASEFYNDREAILKQLGDGVLNPGDQIELPASADIGVPKYADTNIMKDKSGHKYVVDPQGDSHRLSDS